MGIICLAGNKFGRKNVILHINEQEPISCLSYYAPLQSLQTESFLIFSFSTRTLAILINLASIVHAKLVHHKKIFTITGSMNGAHTETTQVFIDYVKIVVWLETCFGMPYSILREITLSINLSDFVFIHVLAVSIFTDSMFGMVEPLVILLKNTRIRKHLVSIFKRKNSRAAIF
uniref:7TM GPCR serpentine receptor class x (Srx) domain-containing protein n=1 Tax=Romanomermis culicivorax TaxID=13658 RepID=A0A915JAV9_ROMCU